MSVSCGFGHISWRHSKWKISFFVQWFVKISLGFGNARLYVADYGMHCLWLHFCWWNHCFRSSWSTFWICSMATSFLYPLSTISSISFLECCESLGMLNIFVKFETLGCKGYFFFNEHGCSDFRFRIKKVLTVTLFSEMSS